MLRIKEYEKEPSENWVTKIRIIFHTPERECHWLYSDINYWWVEPVQVSLWLIFLLFKNKEVITKGPLPPLPKICGSVLWISRIYVKIKLKPSRQLIGMFEQQIELWSRIKDSFLLTNSIVLQFILGLNSFSLCFPGNISASTYPTVHSPPPFFFLSFGKTDCAILNWENISRFLSNC